MAKDTTDRLESWKEIASYVKRDERTAMRWAQLGLPVHRLPGVKRGRVYAFTQEIDVWLLQQSPEALVNGTANVAAPEIVADERLRHSLLRHSLMASAFLLGAALLVAIVLVPRWREARASLPRVTHVSHSGSTLLAKNAEGTVLWTYELSGRIEPNGKPGEFESSLIQDLDGDGRDEVVVPVKMGYTRTGAQGFDGMLLCLDAHGRFRWEYRPSETYRFGADDYGPPFGGMIVMGVGQGRETTLWASLYHNVWYPTILAKLNAEGKELGRFVNSGYIYRLGRVPAAEGAYVLAGGVNNEYDSGALAVLREDDPTGTSPQTPGSKFACSNCPAGSPVRYFIFPRSELNRVTSSPYNKVHVLEVRNNRIIVRVLEVDTREMVGAGSTIYEFDYDFRLLRVTQDDTYWDTHRQLFLSGKVKHPPEKCPEHKGGATPREWRDGRWYEVRLAARAAKQ